MQHVKYISFILLFLFHFNTYTQHKSVKFLKQPKNTVRIFTFNTNKESIFPDSDSISKWVDRPEKFKRIINAIKPQIICLQEVSEKRKTEAILDYFNSILPQKGIIWNICRNRDNIILSIFPISKFPQSNEDEERHAVALIDLPSDHFKKDICLIASHFIGKNSNLPKRINHSDHILRWIKDAITEGGEVTLKPNTPIVIMGDLNAYSESLSTHPKNLIEGQIVNEQKYGSDFNPDWNRMKLVDALPVHNGSSTINYTFRNDASPYEPSILDRVIYTSSVLKIANSYVLNTMQLTKSQLAKLKIKKEDTILNAEIGNYDHFPIIVDFAVIE